MGPRDPKGAHLLPEAQALEDNAHKVLAEKAMARNSQRNGTTVNQAFQSTNTNGRPDGDGRFALDSLLNHSNAGNPASAIAISSAGYS